MKARNIPVAAIPVMLRSISDKSLRQYTNVYRKWWSFCLDKECNPYNYCLDNILGFLLEMVDKKLSYSSINCSRSAISLLFDMGSHDEKIIKRFLKGVYNKNPSKPKYENTWDTGPVLEYLETMFPLQSLSLKEVTQKLTVLLALTSAHRMQTLSKIELKNIISFPDRLEIKISSTIKTSGLNRTQPVLIFPFFKENPKLCVASLINYYIDITRGIRTDDLLIYTYKKPYHAASTQTLSRWIKEILSKSGINTNIYAGYSVRHAATSSAFRAGLNIDAILNKFKCF